MDLATLTDDELTQHYTDLVTEQGRRTRRAEAADQVERITAEYVDAGGDPDDLTAAIDRGRDGATDITNAAAEPPPHD